MDGEFAKLFGRLEGRNGEGTPKIGRLDSTCKRNILKRQGEQLAAQDREQCCGERWQGT
jgi:hypothetical protein